MEVRTDWNIKTMKKDVAPEEVVSVNLLKLPISKDNRTGKYGGRVLTRFPPEQMICRILDMLNLFASTLVLVNNTVRSNKSSFDTNPVKRRCRICLNSMEDVKWLG